jgi:hypothetical protein
MPTRNKSHLHFIDKHPSFHIADGGGSLEQINSKYKIVRKRSVKLIPNKDFNIISNKHLNDESSEEEQFQQKKKLKRIIERPNPLRA